MALPKQSINELQPHIHPIDKKAFDTGSRSVVTTGNIKNLHTIKIDWQKALFDACIQNQPYVVQFILQNLAATRIKLNKKYKKKQTLLHIVSELGFNDIAKILVNYGADTNARDKENITPLHIVVSKGNDDLFRFLLNSPKTLISTKDISGDTAFTSAWKNGNFSAVLIFLKLSPHLLNLQTNLEYLDRSGHFPNQKMALELLTIAYRQRHTSVVDLILRDHRIQLDWLHFLQNIDEPSPFIKMVHDSGRQIPYLPFDASYKKSNNISAPVPLEPQNIKQTKIDVFVTFFVLWKIFINLMYRAIISQTILNSVNVNSKPTSKNIFELSLLNSQINRLSIGEIPPPIKPALTPPVSNCRISF